MKKFVQKNTQKMALLLGLFSVCLGLQSQAADIVFNGAYPNGKGCPAGSYSITWAPDMLSFSILFSNMQAEIPGVNPRESKTAHCGLMMNLVLPPNLQLSIERIDYRGFYALDPGAFWMINSRYFFDNGAAIYKSNGQVMPSTTLVGGIRSNLPGPVNDTFNWGASTESFAANVSPCGGPTGLAVVTNQNVSSGPQPAAGMATLDSADSMMSVVYKLKVTNCQYKFKPYPVNQKIVNDLLKSESL